MEDRKKTFIAFLDDDGKVREDWITIIEQNISYVKFEYRGNIITIPFHRILKIKEVRE